uniref:Uncharacterized protein n=1 Tax=Anguilla anguilla TaxID=7936 RepID=A0A0E9Q777_ANGAN
MLQVQSAATQRSESQKESELPNSDQANPS